MTAKVKSVLTVASEVFETVAGYALVAVGIYAALFVDVTGGGSLWKSLNHIQEVSSEGVQSPNATRVIKVPTQAIETKVHEDRILAVFDEPEPEGMVAAVYQAPDASGQRPSAALTDTPAEPTSGKSWKKGLKGELRNFTVYGKGEEATVASMAAGSSLPKAAAREPAVAVAAGSAAHAHTEAASRPGMSSRLSRGALSASETSRNVR